MTSISITGPGNRMRPARQDQRSQLRLALAALAPSAFFVTGFTLCYTSALQAPARHGVPVAFDVQTVPTVAAAAREVAGQDLYGAYVPAARPGATAVVTVAEASGTSVTSAVESLFRAVAAKQGTPLAVRDVRPLPGGNASGLALFPFIVICTLGGFPAVTATGVATAALRERCRWPLLLAAVVATPALAYLLARLGLGAVGGPAWAVFALLGVGALYTLAVAMISRGLQLVVGLIGTLAAGPAMSEPERTRRVQGADGRPDPAGQNLSPTGTVTACDTRSPRQKAAWRS